MINLLLLFAALQMPVRHVSSTNVTVYYLANMDDNVAKKYLSTIDRLYLDNTSKFKVNSNQELKVRLCRKAYEFSDLTGADSIFSPLWKNGTLYVLNQGEPGDPNYRCVLEAGVIRALLDRFRQNGAPLWLINSVAIYESGEYENCSSPPVENVDYFNDLNEKIQGATSPTDISNLCSYLGATGKFFDLRFGAGSAIKLVQEFQHETSFDEAITKLFRMDRNQLESEWRDFLVKEANSK